MSSYLLPCSCGAKTPVSSTQAGQSIRCACGAQLEVPTLRGLRDLAPAETQLRGESRRARSWDNRHRAALVLVVLALGALATGGYLALGLPPVNELPTVEQFDNALDESPPELAFQLFQEFEKGIDYTDPRTMQYDKANRERRNLLLLGVKIAIGIAFLALVGATGVIVSRPKPLAKRPATAAPH